MVELSADMVLKTARVSTLSEVVNFNSWGSDLSDMSILAQMPLVEVLSLSINNINTLACFAGCSKLRELYLRRNGVATLEELGWLAGLDDLRVLWLSHNPVADLPQYRATVLRLLPNLVKLDDKDVTPEEVETAKTDGVEVEAREASAADGEDDDGDADEAAAQTDDAGAYALSAIKTLLPLLNAEQLTELAAEIASD
eukprot:gene2731-2201_t